jgi:hypothetical protein
MPTQIIFQILGRDPMKFFHPLLESAVVGINVLDMVNSINDPNASREIDGAVNNAEAMRHRSVDGSSITTENGIFGTAVKNAHHLVANQLTARLTACRWNVTVCNDPNFVSNDVFHRFPFCIAQLITSAIVRLRCLVTYPYPL